MKYITKHVDEFYKKADKYMFDNNIEEKKIDDYEFQKLMMEIYPKLDLVCYDHDSGKLGFVKKKLKQK